MITATSKNLGLIETKKVKLISAISQVYSLELLNEIENLVINTKYDWWNNISKAEQDAIDEGLEDIRLGNVISHEQVMKEFNDKYKDL